MNVYLGAEHLQILHRALSDQLANKPQEFWRTQVRYARAVQLAQRLEHIARQFQIPLGDDVPD